MLEASSSKKSGGMERRESSRPRSASTRRSSSRALRPISTRAWAFTGARSFTTGRVEAFAAELIDRFGPCRRKRRTLRIVETKINCRVAFIAKLDVGAKGAVVTFIDSGFPDLAGLLAYVEKLKGVARLRPDSKLVISRDWPTGESRLNGALQISRGLARVIAAGDAKKEAFEPA
jgi:hypothetical protein